MKVRMRAVSKGEDPATYNLSTIQDSNNSKGPTRRSHAVYIATKVPDKKKVFDFNEEWNNNEIKESKIESRSSMNSQLSYTLLNPNFQQKHDDEVVLCEDDECKFLTMQPLKKPFRYDTNPRTTNVRRTMEGEPLRRSILGRDADFNKVEAKKFMQKLDVLNKARHLLSNRTARSGFLSGMTIRTSPKMPPRPKQSEFLSTRTSKNL